MAFVAVVESAVAGQPGHGASDDPPAVSQPFGGQHREQVVLGAAAVSAVFIAAGQADAGDVGQGPRRVLAKRAAPPRAVVPARGRCSDHRKQGAGALLPDALHKLVIRDQPVVEKRCHGSSVPDAVRLCRRDFPAPFTARVVLADTGKGQGDWAARAARSAAREWPQPHCSSAVLFFQQARWWQPGSRGVGTVPQSGGSPPGVTEHGRPSRYGDGGCSPAPQVLA